MGYKFTPMTAQERDERGKIFKEGFVDFSVMHIEDTESKTTHKPMLIINLQIWDENGKSGAIKDYITEDMSWKMHDFLESIGYKDDAETGDIDLNKYYGCEGRGKIKYKKNDEGKWNHQFSYVMPAMKASEPEFNDSLDPLDDIKF
jgi:hypothetical protein